MRTQFVLGGICFMLVVSCAEKGSPEIVLEGDKEMTIYLGEEFDDPGALATDYRGKDISDKITVVGVVGETPGFYGIDYTVTDKKGNFSVESRNVNRGYKNTHLVGAYDVVHTTNNGGGSSNFTGTVAAVNGNIFAFTLDNTNCPTAPVLLAAQIDNNGLQFSIPDQAYNNYDISLGAVNYINNGPNQLPVLSISFLTFNGTITYNHEATWTKQ